MKSKPINPPKLAQWIARNCINRYVLEELEGDLLEVYEDRLYAKGKFYAQMMYWFDVAHLVVGFNGHRSLNSNTNSIKPMNSGQLKNYYTTAIRRLSKDASTSWINFAGLTTGISVCFFILLYIIDEKSYDTFYPDADRVHRVYSKLEFEKGKPTYSTASPYLNFNTIGSDLTGVEAITNVFNVPSPIVSINENVFYENNIYFVDPNFFDFFPARWISGNSSSSLATIQDMVITKSIALKYFGHQDVIGQRVTLRFSNTSNDFSITGVIDEFAHNSTLAPQILISSAVYEKNFPDLFKSWGTVGFHTYVKLHPLEVPENTESRLEKLLESNMGKRKFYSMYLQPLTDVHLNSKGLPVASVGNFDFLFVLGTIGIFILVLACSNYINLTTSRMSLRHKEIALRKVNGARYSDLIKQFYFECALLCTLSFVTAIIGVALLLPVFNQLSEKQIPVSFLISPPVCWSFIGTWFVTILLSGLYPALLLSKGSSIINTLNMGKHNTSGISMRQALVGFQMVVASVLIVCSIMIFKQTNYLSTKEIGLDKEQLLIIDLNDLELARKYEYLKQEFTSVPGVLATAASNLVPVLGTSKVSFELSPDHTGTINNLVVDEMFQHTYAIKMKAGRWISSQIPTDVNNSVVLNQAAVEHLQLENPIGQTIKITGNSVKETTIIGVTENFNYEPLFQTIKPLIMHVDTMDLGFYFPYRKLTLKLEKSHVPETMKAINSTWKAIAPSVPLQYNFFDESFDNAYRSEERMSWLMGSATSLALLIVCLGLTGLSFFVAEVRRREIAIRKVLGGTVWHIISLLTSKYVRLASVAFLISVPITYYIMSTWLDHFAFKTDMSPSVFLAGLIALLTCSWGLTALNTYKSTQANPATVLRN